MQSNFLKIISLLIAIKSYRHWLTWNHIPNILYVTWYYLSMDNQKYKLWKDNGINIEKKENICVASLLLVWLFFTEISQIEYRYIYKKTVSHSFKELYYLPILLMNHICQNIHKNAPLKSHRAIILLSHLKRGWRTIL